MLTLCVIHVLYHCEISQRRFKYRNIELTTSRIKIGCYKIRWYMKCRWSKIYNLIIYSPVRVVGESSHFGAWIRFAVVFGDRVNACSSDTVTCINLSLCTPTLFSHIRIRFIVWSNKNQLNNFKCLICFLRYDFHNQRSVAIKILSEIWIYAS